jgi:predicted Zn-dependent peptidase
MKTARLLPLLLPLAMTRPAAAGDRPRPSSVVAAPAVTESRLANGLAVVLEENHRAPFVSMYLRYETGSRDDPPGKAGLATLTQSMMTTATKHVPSGMYDRWLERAGAGERDWSTGSDASAFWATVPSNAVPLVLWLWSDQMGFFAERADDAMLAGARATTENERREKVDDVAYGDVRRIALRALFPAEHPYHASAEPPALGAVTIEDVRRFHDAHFAPNDATLVLVGDFQTEDVRASIERYFGPSPGAALAPPPHAPVALDREIQLDVAANVGATFVQINWRTPALFDEGDAELDVVARLLMSQRVPTLAWTLIDKMNAATAVTARQISRELGSDFEITAVVAPGHTSSEVVVGIDRLLATLARQGVTDDTLRAALDGVVLPRVHELDRARRRAALYASYAARRGDPRWLTADLGRYEGIASRDTSAAIARWLRTDRRVVTVVTPDASAPRCGVLRGAR